VGAGRGPMQLMGITSLRSHCAFMIRLLEGSEVLWYG